MLSLSSIEKIEAQNRQLSCLIHNWWDATNDEVRWLLNYEIAESKAQRFLRRFIGKSETISPELFEDYILGQAMPMYLRMHIKEEAFIDALPRGRLNRYTSDWINPPVEERRKWIDFQPCSRNNTESELKQARERDWKSGLIVEFLIIILSVQIKEVTHTHTLVANPINQRKVEHSTEAIMVHYLWLGTISVCH